MQWIKNTLSPNEYKWTCISCGYIVIKQKMNSVIHPGTK